MRDLQNSPSLTRRVGIFQPGVQLTRERLIAELSSNSCAIHSGKLVLSAQIEQFVEELLGSGNDSRVAPIHRARENQRHQVTTDVGIR